jgi:ABC-2 type transport system ATP-binding protein
MSTYVVEVDQLTKVYPRVKKGEKAFVAVDSVSFGIKPGEILGLLGPNGAGKSTTIAMLLGVLTPTSGTISYFGQDFAVNQSKLLQDVTFASTYIRMPWRLSVMENLRVYGYMYGLTRGQFEHRVEKFLTRFGVWEQRNKTMNNLSAGQVTRVMLAKAFIPHPKVVLLDEPTASLDPEIAHQIRGFVKEQQKEFDTTILYTSHNMDEVADVCDRVMFLKAGKIVAVDSPENLVKTLKDVTVVLLLTEPDKVNLGVFEKLSKSATLEKRELSVTLPEDKVSLVFETLAKHKVRYSQLSVNKPTLEDYFLEQLK